MDVAVVKSLSHVLLFATPWTIAHKALLSIGFSMQEYSGLPFPSPGNLPNPGINPISPALAGGFFITETLGKPSLIRQRCTKLRCPQTAYAMSLMPHHGAMWCFC